MTRFPAKTTPEGAALFVEGKAVSSVVGNPCCLCRDRDSTKRFLPSFPDDPSALAAAIVREVDEKGRLAGPGDASRLANVVDALKAGGAWRALKADYDDAARPLRAQFEHAVRFWGCMLAASLPIWICGPAVIIGCPCCMPSADKKLAEATKVAMEKVVKTHAEPFSTAGVRLEWRTAQAAYPPLYCCVGGSDYDDNCCIGGDYDEFYFSELAMVFTVSGANRVSKHGAW